MADDTSVGCGRWTCPTVNGGDLVVNGGAVGGYRTPIEGDMSSVKVDVSDMDITRCIKEIYT